MCACAGVCTFVLECVYVNVKCVCASAGRRKQYHLMILLPLVLLCVILQAPRTQWVLKWPGQIVIAGCQVNWTSEVTEAIGAGNLPALSNHLVEQVCTLGMSVCVHVVWPHSV